MKAIVYAFLLILTLSSPAFAATYYVDNTAGACSGNYSIANRDCSGSDGTSYNTIGAAEDIARAGDFVSIREGTYVENVTNGYSGSELGGYITFVAYPGEEALTTGHTPRGSGNVIIDGTWNINGQDYIKIIGIEIKASVSARKGYAFYSTGNIQYVQLLDNYIHNHGSVLVRFTGAGDYVTMRGNKIYYAHCDEAGESCVADNYCWQMDDMGHVIVDYNNISKCNDMTSFRGHYFYQRNNYAYDSDPSYWAANGFPHLDFFQGCGGACSTLTTVLIENNFVYNLDNTASPNSHLVQFREISGDGATDVVARGNILHHHGGGIGEFESIDYAYVVNNTFYDLASSISGSIGSLINWDNTILGSEYACLGGAFQNNIIHTVQAIGTNGIVYAELPNNNPLITRQICYNTNRTTNGDCDSTADPLLTDPANLNLSISSTESYAYGNAIPLTTANGAGSGSTALTVVNARLFRDGSGIVDADKIKIGTGDAVSISSVNSATSITLAEARTWLDGDSVVLAQNPTDIGALPYKAGGYTLTATYTNSGGTVTVTPSDTSLVRFVVVYEDNIPQAPDYDSPYTFSVGSGTIKAQVYSLYASTTPVITATEGTIPSTMKGVNIKGGLVQ